ncbi:hypothetical protein D3C76_1763920 [compost metagenome]
MASSFADDIEMSESVKADIHILVERGIIQGRDNNRFVPKAIATRAEAAKVIDMIISSK